MVINDKASKIQIFFVLQVFSLKFVSSASIISSQVITKSSIILAKHLPFSQIQVAGFQV